MSKTTQVRVGLDQFRLRGQFVSFETLRGLIDMLRYCGPLSVGYDGGDAFHLYLEPGNVEGAIARFESFGIKAETVEGGQA